VRDKATDIYEKVTFMKSVTETLPMPRPKKYVLLDEQDRSFLYHLKERYRKGGALSNAERQHLSNLRQRALMFLQELSLLARELPEEQQAQIFTEKTVQPFVHNLLGKDLKEETRTDRHFWLAKRFIQEAIPICAEHLPPKISAYPNLLYGKFVEVLQLIAAISPNDKVTHRRKEKED